MPTDTADTADLQAGFHRKVYQNHFKSADSALSACRRTGLRDLIPHTSSLKTHLSPLPTPHSPHTTQNSPLKTPPTKHVPRFPRQCPHISSVFFGGMAVMSKVCRRIMPQK